MSGYVQMVDGDNPMVPGIPGSGQDAPFNQPKMQAPAHGIPQFELVPMNIAGKIVNVEYVSIITPGDPKSVPRHKMTDGFRNMYRKAYDAWRNGLEMAPDGTPLEMWATLNPAQIRVLKGLNIFTVEHLVSVADASLHQIPMGRTLRNQAIAFLNAKGKSDSVETARRENEALRSGMAILEKQVADMAAALEKSQTKAPEEIPAETVTEPVAEPARRGPGRPRKDAEAA